MKKKLVCGVLGAMMALSLVACGKKDNGNQADTTTTLPKSSLTVDVCKQYMTLADYKNIEVQADPSSMEVKAEDVQREIDSYLRMMSTSEEIKEGTVKDGDTINMNFSGLLNGVAFANGTATDYTYTVGGNFIKDLDRALVGLEVGKEYELPCRFPDDYGTEELNGKDVIFVVTVNYIENEIVPDYNDEFVKTLTAGSGMELSTTKELEDYVKNYLEEDAKDTYKNKVYGEVMVQLLDASEIKEAPQEELEAAKAMIRSNAENEFNYYGAMYGIDSFENYISSVYGMSMEDFDKQISDYAVEYVNEKMAIMLIADSEGITVSQAEVDEFVQNLLAQSGAASVAELEAQFGENFYDEVNYEIIYNKTVDAIVGYAKIVK